MVEPSTGTPKKTSSLIATFGNVGKALHNCAPVNHSEWIIDFGATDHMTFDNNRIQSIKVSYQYIVSTSNAHPLL